MEMESAFLMMLAFLKADNSLIGLEKWAESYGFEFTRASYKEMRAEALLWLIRKAEEAQ